MNASGLPGRPPAARPTGRTGVPAPAPRDRQRHRGHHAGGVPHRPHVPGRPKARRTGGPAHHRGTSFSLRGGAGVSPSGPVRPGRPAAREIPGRALDGTGVIWTALPSPGEFVMRVRRFARRG